VAAGLLLLPEDLLDDVTEHMQTQTIIKTAVTASFGNKPHVAIKGPLKTNRFLNKGGEVKRTGHKWVLESVTESMWDDAQADELDDCLFEPGANVKKASMAMHRSFSFSFTEADDFEGYQEDEKFAKIQARETLSCSPDEQRWRAFLLAVTSVTGQRRQVETICNAMSNCRNGKQTLYAVTQKINSMVEWGELASVCDVMASKATFKEAMSAKGGQHCWRSQQCQPSSMR
jgi:hypothetical protein